MSEEIVYCIAGNMTSNMSVRILLSQSEAGRLIGEKGKMIKLLRGNFPCDFKLNGCDASQRIMNIKGNLDSVSSAIAELVDIKENPTGLLGRKSLKLLLADENCKKLVKRSALLLRDICQDRGVKITVSPICLPCSTERVVKIEENRGNIMEGFLFLYKALGGEQDPQQKGYNPPLTKKPTVEKMNNTIDIDI